MIIKLITKWYISISRFLNSLYFNDCISLYLNDLIIQAEDKKYWSRLRREIT